MDELGRLKARVEQLERDVRNLMAETLQVMHVLDDHRAGRERSIQDLILNPGDGGGRIDVT